MEPVEQFVQNPLERRPARVLLQCRRNQVVDRRRGLWRRRSLLGRRSSSLRRRVLLLQPLVDKKLQLPTAKKVKERGSQKRAKRATSNPGRKQIRVKAIIRRRA